MHVRIAWEIYNHQQKEKTGSAGGTAGAAAPGAAAADKDKLRAFPAPAPPPAAYRSPYDLPPAPYLPHHPHLGSARYEPSRVAHLPLSLAPHTDRGLRVSGISPFGRYGAGAFPGAPTAFGLSAYGRELALSSQLHGVHHAGPLGAPLHDAWRPRPPAGAVPLGVAAAAAEARRDHDERERARRDRDERERRDREERERRKQREQREHRDHRDHRDRELERARVRSPLRNGLPEREERIKEERKEPPRPPPPALPAYPPPPPWDPYRAFDPLQHMRFAPMVEAALRAEEDRHKMLNAYAHHHQLKAGPLLHRGLPHHAPLPPLPPHPHAHAHAHPHAHAHHVPLPPLAPPLAPLAPLDLLKKEEPR